MKVQIKRASPHQNGKVLGLLMAISSLIIVIPMFLIFMFAPQQTDAEGNPVSIPAYVAFVFPIMYLIFGYIGGAISSMFYNVIVKFVGGFQFELEDLA